MPPPGSAVRNKCLRVEQRPEHLLDEERVTFGSSDHQTVQAWLVDAHKIDDKISMKIARDIAKKIESEMTRYPNKYAGLMIELIQGEGGRRALGMGRFHPGCRRRRGRR